jgi:hypothetical protein
MKKLLNAIITVAGLVLLVGLLIISLNDVINFVDTSSFQGLITYVKQYGAVTLIGALVFVNIIGKGIVRILLCVLILAIAAFYIFSSVFPTDFIRLFGI